MNTSFKNKLSSDKTPILTILLVPTLLSVSGCLPDYEVKRLRVDAMTTDISQNASNPDLKTAWRFVVTTQNIGGTDGIEPDANGNDHLPVPVLFSAYISNDNLNGCPSLTNNKVTVIPGPEKTTLLTWKDVPVTSGPIYSFDNVFATNTNPPDNCVPFKVAVDWDAKKPDFESTITESDEINNGLSVEIVNWQQQKTWAEER